MPLLKFILLCVLISLFVPLTRHILKPQARGRRMFELMAFATVLFIAAFALFISSYKEINPFLLILFILLIIGLSMRPGRRRA